VIRINQVITDVPFGDGTVKSYMDTSSGEMEVELGELENPDAVVTTDWATARQIFGLNDQAAAMQAFMGGKIKVAGDMMKMMAMQTAIPQSDITAKVAEEIKNITE
jgi:putative sterol carrier protein